MTDSVNQNDPASGSANGVGAELYTPADRDGIPVLPMPLRVRELPLSLMYLVNGYFVLAYNGDQSFREYLASVDNKHSVTKNRMFDRCAAVDIIIEMAIKANDEITSKAAPGLIYQCLVHIMRNHNLSLKRRRLEYAATYNIQQAAE